MTPTPAIRDCQPGGHSVTLQMTGDGGDATLTCEFVDEGGGHFVILSTDGKVRLEPAEIHELARWCGEWCTELDAANKGAM